MMNTVLKLAAAASLVAVCSISETQAQQRYYGGSYSGYGNYTYNNNCTGCFPGAGPYDSQIAVTGIAAGAAILNNLIGGVMQQRQQPQQQRCNPVQVGTTPDGRPLFTCR